MTNRAGRWLEQARRKRADRLAALDDELERRLPARYARRRPRRVLAGTGVVLLGLLWVDAAVSWVLAPSDAAAITNFLIFLVLLAAGIPLWARLHAVTRGMTSRRERDLDERQLTARLRAFATAHQATTLVLLVVLLVTMNAGRDGRESQIPGAALFLILFALMVTHISLPLVVSAWQLPDPPDDGEEL